MDITLPEPPADTGAGAMTEAADDMIHVHGADVPEAWKVKLLQWWLEHRYYPDEAGRRGQQGTVTIRVKIDHDGHVRLVGLESTSGSQWLDAGAQAVFRGETLPSLPAEVQDPEKEFDLKIHYLLVRRH
jgi:protein TonB